MQIINGRHLWVGIGYWIEGNAEASGPAGGAGPFGGDMMMGTSGNVRCSWHQCELSQQPTERGKCSLGHFQEDTEGGRTGVGVLSGLRFFFLVPNSFPEISKGKGRGRNVDEFSVGQTVEIEIYTFHRAWAPRDSRAYGKGPSSP